MRKQLFIKAAFWFCVPLCFACLPSHAGAQSSVKPQPEGVAQGKMLHFIAAADSALTQEMTKEATTFYLLALKEAENQKSDDYSLSIKIKLGQCYLKLSRYEDAIIYLRQAEASPLLQDIPEEQAKVLSLLGAVYESIGIYKSAFEYQLKALEIREAGKDSLGIAESRYKIGSLYYYQKQYPKALTYYESALAICENSEIIPQKYVFNCLSALGSVYEEMDMQEKSLRYNTRSLNLAVKTGNERNRAYALLNIGENHTNLGNYAKAGEYLKNALQLSKTLGIPRAEILSYQRIGELLLKQDRPEEAIRMLYQAFLLAKETGSNTLLLDLLNKLAHAQEANENYGAAIQYLRDYTALKDSMLNETTLKEINTLNALYEVEKKEAAIQLLQKERELLEANKKADQLFNSILIGSSILLLALSGLMFFWMMEQRRSNRMLQQLNAQVETQNRQLQSYNDELRQYAYIASHDLQEPLRTISSFISVIKRKYTDHLDEQAQEYMGYIVDGATRLQQMLKDLLAYTRLEREKKDFQLVDSGELIRSVLSDLQHVVDESGARIAIDESSLPVIHGNRLRLSQVFQNLISNAVKFRGEALPLVEIGCLKESDKAEYLFFVKDNGIGIPEDFRSKMFEMFTRLHSREEYEGSGIGLATCRKIIENHNGRIWAESEHGMGSAIFFTLPVPKDKPVREKPRLSRAAASF